MTPTNHKAQPADPTCASLQVEKRAEHYIVTFDGQSYALDATQYRAVDRKKTIPADRLCLWLQSYAEENK